MVFRYRIDDSRYFDPAQIPGAWRRTRDVLWVSEYGRSTVSVRENGRDLDTSPPPRLPEIS